MGVGKYSPTVNRWYRLDQKWHDRHCEPDEWIDREGYDIYGYHHETGVDRAGYTEWDYLGDLDLLTLTMKSLCTSCMIKCVMTGEQHPSPGKNMQQKQPLKKCKNMKKLVDYVNDSAIMCSDSKEHDHEASGYQH
jgi:hypothetical protein